MKELLGIRHSKLKYLVVFVLMVAGLNVYLFTKYRIAEIEIKQVSFVTNIDQNDVLIYTHAHNSSYISIADPIRPEVIGDTFSFKLDREKIRNFRIYIGRESTHAFIRNMMVHDGNGQHRILVKELEGVDLSIKNVNENSLQLSSASDSYLTFKKQGISTNEFCIAELWMLVVCIPICILFYNLFTVHLSEYFQANSFVNAIAALFILTMFLPTPICNVILILAALLVVRKFSPDLFVNNKTGILFILYFIYVVISNIFISSSFNMRIIETTLPIFILPFYFAAAPLKDYGKLLVVSAIVLSIYFMVTSSIDLCIYKNIDTFSFDSFTKYVHPVYISYLLVFSLFYIQLVPGIRSWNYLFYPVLIIALLCCGSKLMICLTVLFFAVTLFKARLPLMIVFLIIVIGGIMLFSPTRKRFQEIANIKSLSILNSYPIAHNDPRLTGLTLRLLIWQETINNLENAKDIIFGKGVDLHSDEILKNKLKERGVRDRLAKYDPHNQFLTTLYKMGLIGLILLAGIVIYGFYISVINHQKLLFWCMLLFTVAMMAESVLQRALGIYFFVTLLVIQSPNLIFKKNQT